MSFLLMKGKRQQAPQQQQHPQRQLQPGGRPGPSILTHNPVLKRGTSGISSLQAKYAPKYAAVPTVTPLRQQKHVPASVLRVAQTQQPRRTTVSQMKQQQQQIQKNQQENSLQAEKQTKAEGEVISMEEVMADLRVLAEQQQESRQQLEHMKSLKKHKISQQSQADARLSELKYQNGECRAQLKQERGILSTSTRELGLIRLQTDKAGTNLDRFDAKLNRALETSRNLNTLPFKIDQALQVLIAAAGAIEERRNKISTEVKEAEQKLDQTLQQEQLFSKAVATLKSKYTKTESEKIAKTTLIADLKADLSTAKQMSVSTRTRVASIRDALNAEEERTKSVIASYEEKFKSAEEAKTALLEKRQAMKLNIEAKKKSLAELKTKYKICREEEGHEIDKERLNVILNELKSCEENEMEEVTAVKVETQQLRAALESYQVEEKSIQTKALALEKEVSDGINEEKKRESDRETLIQQVERQQLEANKLLASVDSLRKDTEKAITATSEALSDKKQETQNNQKLLQDVRKDLEATKQTTEGSKASFETSNNASDAKISSMQGLLDGLTSNVQSIRTKMSLLENPNFEDKQKAEFEELVSGFEIMVQDAKSKISSCLENHPCLANLKFDFELSKNMDDQVTHVLWDLKRVSSSSTIFVR